MHIDNFDEIVQRSLAIREKYRKLEVKHHGSEWKVSRKHLGLPD